MLSHWKMQSSALIPLHAYEVRWKAFLRGVEKEFSLTVQGNFVSWSSDQHSNDVGLTQEGLTEWRLKDLWFEWFNSHSQICPTRLSLGLKSQISYLLLVLGEERRYV
jgi:hypothetical protein